MIDVFKNSLAKTKELMIKSEDAIQKLNNITDHLEKRIKQEEIREKNVPEPASLISYKAFDWWIERATFYNKVRNVVSDFIREKDNQHQTTLQEHINQTTKEFERCDKRLDALDNKINVMIKLLKDNKND